MTEPRRLERSINGKTWVPCLAWPGSIMYHVAIPQDGSPVSDGFGNWYRRPDDTEEQT